MNYKETITYIESISMGDRRGLSDTKKLLEALGNPEKELKIIHVAGTNGKGSICAYLSKALISMGYSVGLFTSPYLEVFNERIKLNGQNISDDELVKHFGLVKEKMDILTQEDDFSPSQFDIITAGAYLYYAEKRPDFVVLEVGLGGEFDSTNTITPIISVISSISMDHTEFLGNTISEIAQSKAGIIKKNIPAVLYQQSKEAEEVIKQKALQMNSDLYITNFDDFNIKSRNIYGQEFDMKIMDREYKDIHLSITGDHQVKNFMTALTCLLVLAQKGMINEITEEIIKESASTTKWNGRTELFTDKPVTVLDGAHNADGSLALSNYIREYLHDYHLIMVFGVLGDKKIDIMAKNLMPLADEIIITEPDNYRAEDSRELLKIVESQVSLQIDVKIVKDVGTATQIAQKRAEEYQGNDKAAVVYSGSLYLIGEARIALKQYYGV